MGVDGEYRQLVERSKKPDTAKPTQCFYNAEGGIVGTDMTEEEIRRYSAERMRKQRLEAKP